MTFLGSCIVLGGLSRRCVEDKTECSKWKLEEDEEEKAKYPILRQTASVQRVNSG